MARSIPIARPWRLAALLACALALGGCATPGGDAAPALRELTPAFLLRLEATEPSLATDGRGTVALVWVTRDSARADAWLAVSRDGGTTFGAPQRVNPEPGSVRSFPEGRPAVAVAPGGPVAVAWSERRGDASGGVDLRIRTSADFGRTWHGLATVHDDLGGPPPGLWGRRLRRWAEARRTNTFHGFPALAFTPGGALLAAWLDDRRTPAGTESTRMTLWCATSGDLGRSWSPNAAVSDSACPCCRPAFAVANAGAVALAYRDGSNAVRDPRLALSRDGGRTFASDTLLSRDGWLLAGCPDTGPALAWDASGGTCVWFTGAAPAGVYAVRWAEDGAPAGPRHAVTDTLAGTAHPVAVASRAALYVGVEAPAPGSGGGRAFALRARDAAGAWAPWAFLGVDATGGALAATAPGQLLACWVEQDDGHPRLRLAAVAGPGKTS